MIDPDGPPPEIDRRSTDRTSTDYTFALRYQPIENLVLRGSYATGFIVPTIGELVPFFIDDFTTSLVDPERGGEVQLLQGITRITGGNPDLEPEDAESFSIGARYEPTWLPGFSMSADYTLIEKKGEIARLSFEEILALFPERVQRAPLEPDAPAGYTAGPIMQIDDSFFNLAASRAEAWDFQVDYVRETVDFGRFSLFAVATWQPELSEQATPDDPMENSIGFRGSPVEWRGNAGIVWEGGPWTLGWNTQYFDSYSVLFQVFTLPQFASSAEREIRAQGRSQIDAQFYHDAFASYAFGASPAFGGTLLENVEFRVGIQNVFEEKTPPIASVNPTSAIYPVTDPRLRTYSVSLRKSF